VLVDTKKAVVTSYSMSVNEQFSSLEGNWTGTNRLNLVWLPDPIKESRSAAVVVKRAGGQCLEIAYTWEFEGKHQEGFIIFSCDPNSDRVEGFWTDSWHSANVLMALEGSRKDDGSLDLLGSYQVPDHPDWGWRTVLSPGEDTFTYQMFNISPEGEEVWAVETVFTRP
jgi:hypothetical protein